MLVSGTAAGLLNANHDKNSVMPLRLLQYAVSHAQHPESARDPLIHQNDPKLLAQVSTLRFTCEKNGKIDRVCL